MAKYKTLKAVAHNFGHSFISLTNYYHNDYVLGHIQSFLKEKQLDRFEINIINKKKSPSLEFNNFIHIPINSYIKWFPELVKSLKSDLYFIKEARLIIEFDFLTERFNRSANLIENPFKCTSLIIDNKNKEYKYEFNDWWYPETIQTNFLTTNNFLQLSIKKGRD
ncbi:hypothetical protein [Aureibacter tunicatorum]|uniref:Uncharacterized protein n=1 Tax=Aureibacter tunicatorum TaxID=866807 RepID=A0AAE3XTG8_9BACT|nr:hypothetical protein [Aureibacter tunicatorum]MDR6241354.1 hypothetical protein [Aureibacter tunicatorum]BDD03613.1 hypothetical protein AUTU_10960 [Aureibacter tunicatorum]